MLHRYCPTYDVVHYVYVAKEEVSTAVLVCLLCLLWNTDSQHISAKGAFKPSVPRRECPYHP